MLATTSKWSKTTTSLSMKLLIDTKARRVLFAEANKDVVDFLFSLLALPIGTAIRLTVLETGNTGSMVGSTGNLYTSVLYLDDPYFLPGADPKALINPTFSSQAAAPNMSLLRLPDPSSKEFFTCGSYSYSSSHGYMTEVMGTNCPSCGRPMRRRLKCVRPDSGIDRLAAIGGARGFVKDAVTYTVTDNLTVTPMSSISSITLLNTLGVRDFGALQEKTVWLGSSEGLAILKASLESKTVLTDVFLGKKRKASSP